MTKQDHPDGQATGPTRSLFSGTAQDVVQARDISGGVHFHTSAARSTPPRQLPALNTHFTGRKRELRELLRLGEAAARGEPDMPGALVISAVTGMPGIGKTTLAVYAAHQLATHFPDGQLFADLRGYTPGLPPLSPAEALDGLLRGLGVGPQFIPPDTAARAALYRDRLAGTRTLILLDNAASGTQVQALLPGTPGSLVIVTTRNELTALNAAHALELGTLSEEDANTLFGKIARLGRRTHSQAALHRLLALCGFLPLTIEIVAARLRRHPDLLIEQLEAELSDEHRRVDRLTDTDRSFKATLDLSYQHLPADEKRLFCLLGLLPGTDTDRYAAAALADSDLFETAHGLESLTDRHLLGQFTSGRFRFHDLVRLYARARAAQDLSDHERRSATMRLMDYYQHAAQSADARLAFTATSFVPVVARRPRFLPSLDSQDEALNWMRTELPNLSAALEAAAAIGETGYRLALPAALAAYLDTAGRWTQASALHTAAARTAASLSNLTAQATALNHLGRSQWRTSNYLGAMTSCQRALELFTALDDDRGQANTLINLSIVQQRTGHYPKAIASSEKALELFTRLDDGRGRAHALNNLGTAHWRTSNYAAASLAHRQAFELFQALNNLQGQAAALNSLGIVRWRTGDYASAEAVYLDALSLFRRVGDRYGQANVLNNLALVRQQTEDYNGAVTACRSALDLFEELGNRQGQATTLDTLAIIWLQTGTHQNVAATLERALGLFQELGDRQGQAEALNHYGELLIKIGSPAQARSYYHSALELARQISSQFDEAESLAGIGETYALEGRRLEAIDFLSQALALYQQQAAAPAERIEARLRTLSSERDA